MAKQTVNGVPQFYGPRDRYEGYKGEEGRKSDLREVVVAFSGSSLSSVSFTLPAGTTVVGNAIAEINEVFVLGGTSPVINVGVSGSEGANRLAQLSQAQAQALGTYSVASAGTLAVNTPLAATATIIVALGGTTPTVGTGGKCKLVVPVKII